MTESAEAPSSKLGELARRVLVAAVGVPLAVVAVWQGGWFLAALMAFVAGMGAREFFRLAEARGGRPLVLPGVALAVFLPLVAAEFSAYRTLAPWAFGGAVVTTILALGGAVWTRGVEGSPLGAATATVVGALYTGGTLSFALLLRHLPDAMVAGMDPALAIHGGFLVAFPITVTWIGDSAAYFAGKRWGRNKLVPRISPGKTWEGGLAGLLAAVVTSVLFALVFLDPDRPLGMGVPMAVASGLLIGIAAQLGDLTESVLKREAGVKDSGSLLPGHGGVLDRFDALFFTIPLGYLLVTLNSWL
ncbi:MAG: phosphatidate cytidylyltransferase [Longimicrobiales bacterium]|nr:phosphatidate cytidylyltransferase [Longimicrobiales bacterium]